MKKQTCQILASLLALTVFTSGFAQTLTPAPAWTAGKWFNSSPLSNQSLRGKVVLVNIWTIECSNCSRSISTLKTWLERYRTQGLEVVGIHTPETKWQKPAGLVAQWIKREGITWPVLQDNENVLWNAYGANAWPTFYLIDRKGNIRFTERGELSSQFSDGIAPFEANIKTLLAEKP